MKIAVCLSGMMRNFENTYPNFKKHIIDQHMPDIFFCGYPNSKGLEYCREKLISFYNPKDFILNEYNEEIRKKICNNEDIFKNNVRTETKINNFLSQLYNIYQSDILRQKYELKNNFKYDVVIRSRIDVFYFKKFELEELLMAKYGYVLIPTEWDFKSVDNRAVSDSFAMTNSQNMSKYSNLFNNYEKLFNEGTHLHPETLFGVHMLDQRLNRIEIKGHGWYKFEDVNTGKDQDRHGY